jgi:ribonuclease HI
MIFGVASWHIWDNTNACQNGEVEPHPLRVSEKITAYIDFISLNSASSEGSIMRETSISTQKWSPPLESLMLINVDAAIFSNTGRSGYGAVMRNYQGIMKAACQGFVDHVQCPEIAEAVAIRQPLTFVESIGVLQVVSDCLSVINKLQQQALNRSPTGAIVHDIKLKAKMFVSCTFKRGSRLCNVAAHILAKSAEYDSGSCWFNESPEVIRGHYLY